MVIIDQINHLFVLYKMFMMKNIKNILPKIKFD